MKRWLILIGVFLTTGATDLFSDSWETWLQGLRAEYYLSTTAWSFNDGDNPTIIKVKIDRSVDVFQNLKVDVPIGDWVSSFVHFSFADFGSLGPLVGRIFGSSDNVSARGSLETGVKVPIFEALIKIDPYLTFGLGEEERRYFYLGYRLKRNIFTWTGTLQDVWLYTSTGFIPYQGASFRMNEGQSYSASNEYTAHSFRFGMSGIWGLDIFAGLLLKYYRTAQPMMFNFEDQIAEIENRITAFELGFLGPIVMIGGVVDHIGDENALYVEADFSGYVGGYTPVLQTSPVGGGWGAGTKLGLFLVLDLPHSPSVHFKVGGQMDYSMFGTFGSATPNSPLQANLTYQSASSGGPVTLPRGTLVSLNMFRMEGLYELQVSASIKL